MAWRVSANLLDTSVLIARDPIATPDLPPTAAISVVSLGELRAGTVLARDESVRRARQRRMDAVRAAFTPLSVDESVAERYGDVLAVARSNRRAVKATDLLIIATAAATDRTLYTLDAGQRALARLAGVAVVAVGG